MQKIIENSFGVTIFKKSGKSIYEMLQRKHRNRIKPEKALQLNILFFTFFNAKGKISWEKLHRS